MGSLKKLLRRDFDESSQKASSAFFFLGRGGSFVRHSVVSSPRLLRDVFILFSYASCFFFSSSAFKSASFRVAGIIISASSFHPSLLPSFNSHSSIPSSSSSSAPSSTPLSNTKKGFLRIACVPLFHFSSPLPPGSHDAAASSVAPVLRALCQTVSLLWLPCATAALRG